MNSASARSVSTRVTAGAKSPDFTLSELVEGVSLSDSALPDSNARNGRRPDSQPQLVRPLRGGVGRIHVSLVHSVFQDHVLRDAVLVERLQELAKRTPTARRRRR